MTVRTVTPASNLATTNAAMVAGDKMFFAPGTYSIGVAITAVAGCFYIGAPGAILSTTAAVDVFVVAGAVSNVYISGFTIDETNFQSPDAAIYVAGNPGVAGSGVNNITIANILFQNIGGVTPCILVYQSDNIRIDYNTSNNCYQFVSCHNNDTANAHGNFSISHNTVRGCLRMGIETQTTNLPYNNLHVNFNTIVDCLFQEGMSLVETALTAVGGTAIGNLFIGCLNAFELSNSNFIVHSNVFISCDGCLLIGTAPNTSFFGNIMKNCVAAGIFGQDGGYVANQYIGFNSINGISTFGWSGNTNAQGFTGATFTIPDYAPQTEAQLDVLFQNTGAAGRIVPNYMRTLWASSLDKEYMTSDIYP